MKLKFYIKIFMVVIILTTINFSCKNDIATIKKLSTEEDIPEEQAQNISLSYSDSAEVVFVLKSKIMNKYFKNDPYQEFPKGLKIFSYEKEILQTTLTANYAIRYDNRKFMEAKNNVIIINHIDDEKIETEHIVWDQQKRTIYSNVFVKRTSKDGVMYGDGFDSDETFSRYTIRNPRATFIIEEQ